MDFTCKVNMDNAAFEDDDAELLRIVEDVAAKIGQGRTNGTCVDANGNTVGEWSIG